MGWAKRRREAAEGRVVGMVILRITETAAGPRARVILRGVQPEDSVGLLRGAAQYQQERLLREQSQKLIVTPEEAHLVVPPAAGGLAERLRR